jgi:rhodanese-related sulfurtransferase
MKTVSVTEARALQEQGYTYVDVRSTPEFAAGHPAGAVNVPIIEPDEDTGQMQPNPDFLRVMQANFPADAKLLVGCQVGGRSGRAAQILGATGFTDVANVRGGFSGAHDRMSGRVIDSGWLDENLPVEDGDPAGRSYRDLLAKADDAQ